MLKPKQMLCRMRQDDLDEVLAWRNHSSVRNSMLNQKIISSDEHKQWFDRANGDNGRRLMLLKDNGKALGFVHFSGLAHGAIADWGFYTAPDAAKGTGWNLGCLAINMAFEEFSIHKLCGQVLSFNAPSINLHRRLGFRHEGTLRDQHRLEATYYDLICFGLLDREWLEQEWGKNE